MLSKKNLVLFKSVNFTASDFHITVVTLYIFSTYLN